jgi:hypothetical protein
MPVYRFDNTFDWFVARNEEHAKEEWLDYHDGEDEAPDPELMHGDDVTEWSFDDGDTVEELTWDAIEARNGGSGWLGREL